MKIAEIVAQIKEQNASVIGKMNDKAVERLLRIALVQVRNAITEAEDNVQVEGLGRFSVRNVDKIVKGEKVATRRVIYVAPKPRPAAEAEPAAE
jgi:nucleoid DNA-binding protein